MDRKKIGKYLKRLHASYTKEVELKDENPSLETTFGKDWQKEWIVYECPYCNKHISRPINDRQLSVKCDECDTVIRRKKGKWYTNVY